ncbi:hypothetical protein N0V88_000716 [Collariella sp. IMI 366227]|nr:hypothetical protein N0V88_000716 [Collariella sp. IMI 366227]
MAGDLTDQEIEKRRREKARKRGKSAMRKALETGRDCEIFTAFVYWNPTHRRLEGTVYLPEDVDLPNVNDFHEQAKQVQDEIVVEPAQSSPEEDEPDEDQPSTPTLQSEATDHSGSRTDGNITQTINADSANQITRNEQSVDDMDIDSLRMDPEVEPSRVAPRLGHGHEHGEYASE